MFIFTVTCHEAGVYKVEYYPSARGARGNKINGFDKGRHSEKDEHKCTQSNWGLLIPSCQDIFVSCQNSNRSVNGATSVLHNSLHSPKIESKACSRPEEEPLSLLTRLLQLLPTRFQLKVQPSLVGNKVTCRHACKKHFKRSVHSALKQSLLKIFFG